jgi:hypothetical protein
VGGVPRHPEHTKMVKKRAVSRTFALEIAENTIFLLLNPLTTTRNYSYTHFCQFLAVLEYSPIGVKFPLTIAWRILYTVKKTKFENFQNFFCFESFKTPK